MDAGGKHVGDDLSRHAGAGRSVFHIGEDDIDLMGADDGLEPPSHQLASGFGDDVADEEHLHVVGVGGPLGSNATETRISRPRRS
jgi:hypothetical protein